MVVGRPESQEKRREDKIIIKLYRRGVRGERKMG